MIDPILRALDGQLPVPLVIVMCWGCLALGALIFGGGPPASLRKKSKLKLKLKKPKKHKHTTKLVVDTEPEPEPETYGRHAPPTAPLPSELILAPRDVVARPLPPDTVLIERVRQW